MSESIGDLTRTGRTRVMVEKAKPFLWEAQERSQAWHQSRARAVQRTYVLLAVTFSLASGIRKDVPS